MFDGLTVASLIQLTMTCAIQHKIEVQLATMPVKQKIRLVPYIFLSEFKSIINRMLTACIIRPINSAWSTSVNLVLKTDKSIRAFQDYRKLNSMTINDAYPLPNINQILN